MMQGLARPLAISLLVAGLCLFFDWHGFLDVGPHFTPSEGRLMGVVLLVGSAILFCLPHKQV